MNEVALHLKVARRKAGLTQNDCAHLLGVHPSKVSLFETGKTLPNLQEACVLALIYGRPLESLLSGVATQSDRAVAARLGSMPDCPHLWLGRFNRQNTLNALAARLEGLDRRSV